ncbi:MAG: DnaJ domain-containing protein [Tepidisphaera sp.]|nr:DnaJ domain-containing protein [Tepidisphaera sp.]
MGLLVFILIVAAAAQGWKWVRRQQDSTSVNVRWSNELTAPISAAALRTILRRFLVTRGCTVLETKDGFDIYGRGDPQVRSIPCERDIGWREVPMVLGAMFQERPGGAWAKVTFNALSTVQFSAAGTDFFWRQARAEFEDALALVNHVLREDAEAQKRDSAANGNERRSCAAENDERGCVYDADLEMLGLRRDATWEQVQAAYRDACRKYHPDRLNGQNVEPHLVELAVERFKEVSAAYQRLKDRLGQPQHA